jgi:hypothetical protein
MVQESVKNGNTALEDTVLVVDPAAPPSLAYTSIKSIVLDGNQLSPSEHYWNSLLVATIRKASETTPSEKLSALIICGHQVGKRKGGGFKFIADLNISLQAQSAAGAWKATYHILQQAKLPLELEFQWENHPSAAFPGVHATMCVGRP